MMEYKGYIGKVEFNSDAAVFHGEAINIRDVVSFEGTSVNELTQAFHDSVDDYLEFCKERNESPQKPFSGKFVVRLSPELHRKLSIKASLADKSLNSLVTEVLEEVVEES